MKPVHFLWRGYKHERQSIEVVDTPGIYSLSAALLDEEVARDYVLSGKPDLIVNIIDASNIERNLYLTSQLMEMLRAQVPTEVRIAKTIYNRVEINKLSGLIFLKTVPDRIILKYLSRAPW